MFEVSHEECQSAGSAPAHMQIRMFREQTSMKVLPAAWQHQVPQAFEAPFSGGQAQHPRGAAEDDKVPVNIQSHAAPLAEYHLAVPAPAGSTVLQLVSQAGLQIGDLLLIEQGTIREEFGQVVGFGSIV